MQNNYLDSCSLWKYIIMEYGKMYYYMINSAIEQDLVLKGLANCCKEHYM